MFPLAACNMPLMTTHPKPCNTALKILKERGLTQISLCYDVFAKTGVRLTPQHLNAALKGREIPNFQMRTAIAATLGLPLGSVFPEYHQTADRLIEWFGKLPGRIDFGTLAALAGIEYARVYAILKKQDAPTYWERQQLARVAGLPVSELFPEFENF